MFLRLCSQIGLSLVTLATGSVGDEVVARWVTAWGEGAPLERSSVQFVLTRLETNFAAAAGPEGDKTAPRIAALDLLGLRAATASAGDQGVEPDARQRESFALQRRLTEKATALLDGDLGACTWAITEVIAPAAAHPLARREAALTWTLRAGNPDLVPALLLVARQARDPLRSSALGAMAGWAARNGPDESIDVFLVDLLGKGSSHARPQPFGLLQERITTCPIPLGSRATERLIERVRAMLQTPDWREAARAIQLAQGITHDVRVPLLLDALSAWVHRRELGRGSRRIEGDLAAELTKVSGRNLGSNPGNWIAWWVAVRQGRATLPTSDGVTAAAADSSSALENDSPRSRAEFFGLRPQTDRVTFIIDHSGSMSTRFGTRDVSRYEEAVAQFGRYLQALGPGARFNVILFDSTPLLSSRDLIEATAANIERASIATLGRPPSGGTNLQPAVELALCIGADGHVDTDALVADTVIVLCDGETTEGHAWVAPLLERVQPSAQVRFHCIQIGLDGGRVLRELAERSGGEFLRVEG